MTLREMTALTILYHSAPPAARARALGLVPELADFAAPAEGRAEERAPAGGAVVFDLVDKMSDGKP